MVIKSLQADLLKISVYDSRIEMGEAAAKAVALAIHKVAEEKKSVNVVFAAAPSQNEMLEALLREEVDFSVVNAFHMDEYAGLSRADSHSFASYLSEHIFDKADFKSVNFIQAAGSIEEGCEGYAKLLRNNPPDIVCMGIGENGHIAFNDPPVADFCDKKIIKVVELDEVCRQQQVHDKCFAAIEEVPKYALTLTVPTLMSAGYIICTVPGGTKAAAVQKTIYDSISEHCPATILREHKNAAMFLDRESAEKIL
jgi:glucosamine-6-phosphate deaminase